MTYEEYKKIERKDGDNFVAIKTECSACNGSKVESCECNGLGYHINVYRGMVAWELRVKNGNISKFFDSEKKENDV